MGNGVGLEIDAVLLSQVAETLEDPSESFPDFPLVGFDCMQELKCSNGWEAKQIRPRSWTT